LIAKGLILLPTAASSTKDQVFLQTMTRTGRAIELCQGPLLFSSIVFYICNFHFKTSLGTYLIASMGVGDGIAPLVGSAFPILRYRTLGRGEFKTVSGSLAMLAGTLFAIPMLSWLLGAPAAPINLTQAVGVALVATLAEAVSGAWDNLAVPLAVYLYYSNAMVG
jgi:phytol kinase